MPSIGFTSCRRADAGSSSCSIAATSSEPSRRATSSSVSTSRIGGRNSCSGGSSSRIVTGSPSIASKMPSKSPCCSGSSSAGAARRSVVGRRPGSSPHRRDGGRSPKNMCSVRQRPMPSAPKLAGAARRPRGCRRWSARRAGAPRRPSRGPSRRPCSSPARPAAPSSAVISPAEPSIATGRPRAARPRRRSAPRLASSSTLSVPAPATQGRPMPRATSAACEALPPSAVRMPLAAWKPPMSSASVKERTRITSLALGGAPRSPSPRRRRPRPGRLRARRRRLGEHARTRRPGSKVGCSSVSSVPGVDRQQRLARARADLRRRRRRRSGRRPAAGRFAVARLQHVEAAFLDRELDVLHVAVVALERPQDRDQLLADLGVPLAQLGERRAASAARDDVLALGVGQEVAGGLGRPGHLVAAEGDAGAGVSPLLPNTICCTLTAVPQLSGM